jgi:hypothetical protein
MAGLWFARAGRADVKTAPEGKPEPFSLSSLNGEDEDLMF